MRSFRDRRLFERGESRFIWAKLRDEHGRIKPVSTRCTDEEAASLFCNEWERKAADPAYRVAAEATLDSAVGDFFAELRRSKVSDATYEIAETKLGHFVRLWGADWPLLRISNTLVLAYIDAREKEGVVPYTVKKELSHLERTLAWARFRGSFPHDLATIFPPNYSGKHKPKKRAPSREEVARLLMNMQPRRAAHVAFIVATGARWSESVRAQREDVDLKALLIHLRGKKTELASGAVPVTGVSWDFIVFALEHAPGSAGEPLFAKWSSGSYWRDIQAACVRADIEALSPNDLRRAFGGWHRQAILLGGGGKDSAAEQTSIMLRHTTDKLTQTTYARISAAELGASIRGFAPVPILPGAAAETAESDTNETKKDREMLHARCDSNTRHPASKASTLGSPQSPRTVGNKQAHARRVRGGPVSVLTADLGNKAFRAHARRWLTRAA